MDKQAAVDDIISYAAAILQQDSAIIPALVTALGKCLGISAEPDIDHAVDILAVRIKRIAKAQRI